MSGIADDVDVEEEEETLVDAVDAVAIFHGLSNEKVTSPPDMLAGTPTVAVFVVRLA